MPAKTKKTKPKKQIKSKKPVEVVDPRFDELMQAILDGLDKALENPDGLETLLTTLADEYPERFFEVIENLPPGINQEQEMIVDVIVGALFMNGKFDKAVTPIEDNPEKEKTAIVPVIPAAVQADPMAKSIWDALDNLPALENVLAPMLTKDRQQAIGLLSQNLDQLTRQQKINLITARQNHPPIDKEYSDRERLALAKLKEKQGVRCPVRLEEGKDGVLNIESDDTNLLRAQILDTVGTTCIDTGAYILNQAVKARVSGDNLYNSNAIIDMVNGIRPQDQLEGMLAVQMVATHNMAMEFSKRAMYKDQAVDAVERNINRVTKLMRTFTAQMEALNKHRSGGQQSITVKHQHINVSEGGQAMIAENITGPGRG